MLEAAQANFVVLFFLLCSNDTGDSDSRLTQGNFIIFVVMLSQEMNNVSSATEYYKDVLKQDNTHVEALACIGSNHFYTDQPEIALRFYRSDKLLWISDIRCGHKE